MARYWERSNFLWYLAGGLLIAAPPAWASHLTMRLRQAVISGAGEPASNQTVRLMGVMGEAVGGMTTNGDVRLRNGFQASLPRRQAGSRAINVEGAIEDLTKTNVVVNGVAASQTGEAFCATGVRLLEGLNTLSVTATDRAGNWSQRELTVWLATRPPARPTVTPTPAVATESQVTLSGTKMPGTSLWLNGSEVVPFNDESTWELSVELQEGDNGLWLVAKDAVDNASTRATQVVVLDRLPPIVSVSAPDKTNLTPVRLQGTVDDSLTRITADGHAVTQTGRAFEVDVPLQQGENSITLVALSPTGLITSQLVTVTLGTIPVLTAITPDDGSLLVADQQVQISASATDNEGNPVEYQLWKDGVLMTDWTATALAAWTPASAEFGAHALEAKARDGFGGEAAKQADVFVVHQPVSPQ